MCACLVLLKIPLLFSDMFYSMQKVVLYNWNEEAVVGKYKGPEKDITQVSLLQTTLSDKNL